MKLNFFILFTCLKVKDIGKNAIKDSLLFIDDSQIYCILLNGEIICYKFFGFKRFYMNISSKKPNNLVN